MAAVKRSYGVWVIVVVVVLWSFGVEGLPWEQVQALLKVREVLQTPSVTANWNDRTEFCNLCSPQLCIICSAPETVTYLRIVGYATKKLPRPFSATDLVDAILAFPELRGLELTNLGMSGSLPGTLALMRNLQVVNFTNNFFSGEIPGTMSKLAGLRVLAMDNNDLSGGFPYFIPSLDTLSLSNNQLTMNLNASLSSFKNLRFLSLNNNSLSGAIPAAIASLPNLQVLHFSFYSVLAKFS